MWTRMNGAGRPHEGPDRIGRGDERVILGPGGMAVNSFRPRFLRQRSGAGGRPASSGFDRKARHDSEPPVRGRGPDSNSPAARLGGPAHQAVAKVRDLERGRKIAQAGRGKPRPRHVIEAITEGRIRAARLRRQAS